MEKHFSICADINSEKTSFLTVFAVLALFIRSAFADFAASSILRFRNIRKALCIRNKGGYIYGVLEIRNIPRSAPCQVSAPRPHIRINSAATEAKIAVRDRFHFLRLKYL